MLYTQSSANAIRDIIDGIYFTLTLAEKGSPYDEVFENYPDYRGQAGLAYDIKAISDEVGEYSSENRVITRVITRVGEAAKWLNGRLHEKAAPEPLCMELAGAYIKVLQTATGDRNAVLGMYRHLAVGREPHEKDTEVALRIVNATETILTKKLRKKALINGKNGKSTMSLARYLMTYPYPVSAKIFRENQDYISDKDMPTDRMEQ